MIPIIATRYIGDLSIFEFLIIYSIILTNASIGAIPSLINILFVIPVSSVILSVTKQCIPPLGTEDQ